MSNQRTILLKNAAIFLLVWYTFTCVTSGTMCPAGIFLPCILIGCALGQLYGPLHNKIFHPRGAEDPELIKTSFFSIIGATAVLSGATRMTFALAVVMLETTASVDLFLPIIFTLFISYGTGNFLISKSVYLSALRSKNIPLLGKSVPCLNRSLSAFNIMHAPVRSMPFIVKVGEAYAELERASFNGFPVLNSYGRPVGIIERDVLITMIERKAWYQRQSRAMSGRFGSSTVRTPTEPGVQVQIVGGDGGDAQAIRDYQQEDGEANPLIKESLNNPATPTDNNDLLDN